MTMGRSEDPPEDTGPPVTSARQRAMEATHEAADRAPCAPARTWPRAIGLAAAVVYVPQLLPLVSTDVAGDAHCLAVYTRYFPVLTGMPFGLNARIASDLGEPLEEYVLTIVAALVALTLVGSASLALRRWRRGGLPAAVAIAALSAAFSMAAVAFIRA